LTRLVRAQDRERRALEIELELYRTLGTIGTTVAVFAHESARPVQNLTSAASLVESQGRKALGSKYDATLAKQVAFIRKATDALRTFSNLPLRLLAQDKRKVSVVDVNVTISELLSLFEPYLVAHRIRPEAQPSLPAPEIYGTRTALESIVANLVTNAIAALVDARTQRDRVLRWTTETVRDRVLVTINDSGPGIRGIEIDDIWLPGRTTRENGTGLGLTIVRDAARDLQGHVSVAAHGDLGGAEFTLDLPLWNEEEG
jgi:C4-dicarboxylate-specific signal transduction histidine kinase